jgi:hypothetical protein
LTKMPAPTSAAAADLDVPGSEQFRASIV